MQLYSSVLNSEQIKAEEESSNNKKFAIPKALSDLKTTLRENIDKKREALKRTFSEDFEADAPESLHETVILEKRLSPGIVLGRTQFVVSKFGIFGGFGWVCIV